MNEDVKHKWKNPLPLPTDVVRRPISKNLKLVETDIKNCMVIIDGLGEFYDVVLEYLNSEEGYLIKNLTNNLQGDSFYKGKIVKENEIHPIEIEFHLTRFGLGSSKQIKEEPDEIPVKYQQLINEAKKSKEVDAQALEERYLKLGIPEEYIKKIIAKRKGQNEV